LKSGKATSAGTATLARDDGIVCLSRGEGTGAEPAGELFAPCRLVVGQGTGRLLGAAGVEGGLLGDLVDGFGGRIVAVLGPVAAQEFVVALLDLGAAAWSSINARACFIACSWASRIAFRTCGRLGLVGLGFLDLGAGRVAAGLGFDGVEARVEQGLHLVLGDPLVLQSRAAFAVVRGPAEPPLFPRSGASPSGPVRQGRRGEPDGPSRPSRKPVDPVFTVTRL
jgi:hypothetical protein